MATNALIHEKSPYLRQHAHNPVAWLPWGEAAFEIARSQDKPIFLSIGYSTCHWCHVMARESFEDEELARLLNNHFVPVKIDREERPDIDRVYMLFVQASTGSGGWPMSVWLTPDLKPFYGGTYFPPNSRYGRPGFRTLLEHLAEAWKSDRQRIVDSSISVTEQLRSIASVPKSAASPDRELADMAFAHFRRTFDSRYGGFGGAPKFPRPSVLNFLLRYHYVENSEEALDMVTKTLRAMAAGGMRDHLGGGFHRYSVDERWFVPHFEKMLYDQAQLAVSYLETFQLTHDPGLAAVAEDILTYVTRDLTSIEGAFYSAEDADSSDPENPLIHGEGAFYLWRQREIEAVLGHDAASFCEQFGVQPEGNVENDPQGEFSGRNILFASSDNPTPDPMTAAKEKLVLVRASRPRPHLDRKILTGWNGLMISAFARAAGILGNQLYLKQAIRAAEFILGTMYDRETGRLLRRFCDGEAVIDAFADDYAFFAQGLLDLFEVTGEPRYLEVCLDLCRRGLKTFEDETQGGFFSTRFDAADVLIRLKDEYDGAEPSVNSVAADLLLRLAHLTDSNDLQQMADKALAWLAPRLHSQGAVSPQALVATMRSLSGPIQSAIRTAECSEAALKFARGQRANFEPFKAVLLLPDQAMPALKTLAPFLGNLPRKGQIASYECRDFVCQLPQIVN